LLPRSGILASKGGPMYNSPFSMERRWYITIRQAAGYLGVSQRTVRNMISDSRLTAYRNGARMVRLDLHEIDHRMMRYGGSAK
jgi:excisionase family DNA binding protein